jgi:selenide,water dikinase
MVDAGAHAATDVTGFGLLGHLREMLAASGVSARLDLAAIPVLAGTRDLLEAGCFPGGSQRNLQASNSYTDGAGELSDRQILSDAQTSGGLLISLPIEDSGGIPGGRVIGEVVDGPARIQLS